MILTDVGYDINQYPSPALHYMLVPRTGFCLELDNM